MFRQLVRQALHIGIYLVVHGADLECLLVNLVWYVSESLRAVMSLRLRSCNKYATLLSSRVRGRGQKDGRRTYNSLRILRPRGAKAELAQLGLRVGGEGV